MSTRSRIAIEHDGKFESIYCHNDGYLGYVGRKLQEHYDNPVKVRALMKLGDISSLGDDLKPEGVQKFDDITDGKFCRPYSLRGEDCPSQFDDTLKQLYERTENCWGEFLYVYMKDYDGIYSWFVWEIGERNRLDVALKELEEKERR